MKEIRKQEKNQQQKNKRMETAEEFMPRTGQEQERQKREQQQQGKR